VVLLTPVVFGTEYVAFRWFFTADLPAASQPVPAVAAAAQGVPVFTRAVVAVTLAGFLVTSAAGVNPAWAAVGGAAILAARTLARRRTTVVKLAGSADVSFLAFVLGLGIVVHAVTVNGLGGAVRPGSWSITRPARSCWSGPPAPPPAPACPRHPRSRRHRPGQGQAPQVTALVSRLRTSRDTSVRSRTKSGSSLVVI
jgi:hypothetical protein